MSQLFKNHLFNLKYWPDEQKRILFAIRRGEKIEYTSHYRHSLAARDLRAGEVMTIFKNGTAEIIQGHDIGTYPIAKGKLNYDELRVFYGKTDSGKVIHVVMAPKAPMKFITVYFPDPAYFESNLKTLKPEYGFKEIH